MAINHVMVVGCGAWGLNLVRTFAHLGALHAVVDLSAERRTQAQAIAPGVRTYESYTEALANDPSAVVLATPAETHAALADQALRAHRDVFVEKPLTTSTMAGLELVALAAQKQRILMVGHIYAYHPAIRLMLEYAQQGDLGKILSISSTRLSPGPIRSTGGVLWCPAPHDVGLTLAFAEQMPERIAAWGTSYRQPDLTDMAQINLGFESGIWANLTISWFAPYKERRLVITGSEQVLCFDDVAGTLTRYPIMLIQRDGRSHLRTDGIGMSYAPDEPLLCECQAFLEAIITRHPPLTAGRAMLPTLRVLEAAQHSLEQQGSPIYLSQRETSSIDPWRVQDSAH